MNKLIPLSILILSGCAGQATGPMFSEPEKPSIIIYTNYSAHAWFGNGRAGTWNVHVNGQICKLHDKSFFIVKTGKVLIASDDDAIAGTTKHEINDNHSHYIRMDIDHAKLHLTSLGLVGMAMLHNDGGMFVFDDVSEEQALKELSGLHQDCM